MKSAETLLFVSALLATTGSVHAQDVCIEICAAKFSDSDQEQSACKEGCRLQVIFEFTSGSKANANREDCYNGCSKSYDNVTTEDACKFGCFSQPPLKKNQRVHVTINNKEPSFDVAFGALKKVFANPLSFGSLDRDSFSEERQHPQPFENIFADMHRRMQQEMNRFNQIANDVMNMQQMNAERPNSHGNMALEGPSVDNKDLGGEEIIEVAPVNLRQNEHFLGHMGENPTMVEIQDSSLLSRLATRARRLSVLSRWLVCAALFLCLISMLSISVAIFKQIKSQRYHNLRNTHMMPRPFVDPTIVKKVPIDEPAKFNDYPLIHETPPPAYDDLSIRKGELPDQEEPKI